MAYCLRSFVETLDQVLNPHKHHKKWVLHHDHRPQIQSLFENATFLQDFLDKSSPLIQERISSLEDRIMDAAQKAADILETYITGQILLNPKKQTFTIFPPNLGEVRRVFEDAKQEVSNIKDVSQSSNNYVSPPVSTTRYPNSKNVVVGVEEDLNQLRSRLTSARVTELDIIPIVGMGGIGKTTLARILYDEFSSKSHFDRCAWVTVSQSYDPQQVLKTILACVTGKPLNEIPQLHTSELITTLYQTLVGRRYLIILDDIWSSKAWDDMQRAFARDNEGSRVVFTTREKLLADYVKSNGHVMRLVNEDESWELLRGKVFGEDSCPPELEKVGKRITLKCGGLPLALQVIGGLLAHSQRSEEFWEYVAHNVSSLIAKTDDQFAGIFSWSFAHLPHYLKPCFLYMGAFPEDYKIPAPRLIKLWVAEGFLYPVPNKSLEEAAEIHLNALVNRNLIFVRTTKNGKTKTFGIHDLLRDLCLRKAKGKKFLYVKDSKTDILQEDILCLHRVSVHWPNNSGEYVYKSLKLFFSIKGLLFLIFYDIFNLRAYISRFSVHWPNNSGEYFYKSLKLTSFARSFLVTGYSYSSPERYGFVSTLCFKLSLLRVLDAKSSSFLDLEEAMIRGYSKSSPNFVFQEAFLHLVNLRYLAINFDSSSTARGISVLKNLQTLIVWSIESLTILEHLPQLRHLQFQKLEDKNTSYSLEIYPHENLQRLSEVPLDNLTYLLEKIPNMRKLVIDTEDSFSLYHSVVDLTCFQKLESLKFHSGSFFTLFSNIIFPQSLKRLKLIKCILSQTLLGAISILPELQLLKLSWCEFENSTWELTEGGFCELEYLEISWSKIENWLPTEIHFPVLRRLVLDRVPYLDEIPNDIGGIVTLEMIELDYCKASFFESARAILKEQQEFGNTLLQLRLGLTIEDLEKEQAENEDFAFCLFLFFFFFFCLFFFIFFFCSSFFKIFNSYMGLEEGQGHH